MREDTLTKLKAKRDALDQRIANHKPLSHSAAVNKVRSYAIERGMTQDDLFPAPIDPYANPGHEPTPEFEETPFQYFRFEDTFGYTFIGDLKEQRDEIHAEICAIQREAIQRARAFIHEYDLTKEDIFPKPDQAAK
jgi:hypothetical protein